MPHAADVERILFPDPVELALAALNPELAAYEPGVVAYGRVPSARPHQFVRVIDGGGGQETFITENATLIVEGWAQTETRASQIVRVARAILLAQHGALFGVTTIARPTNLPDPTTSQERYTSTIGARVRGTSLA